MAWWLALLLAGCGARTTADVDVEAPDGDDDADADGDGDTDADADADADADSDDGGMTAPFDEALEICEEACARAAECGWRDRDECARGCLDVAAVVRGDALRAIDRCILDLPCDHDPSECTGDIGSLVEPRPAHEEWADRCRERVADCGLANPDECRPAVVAAFPDEDTELLTECFDVPCPDIEECIGSRMPEIPR